VRETASRGASRPRDVQLDCAALRLLITFSRSILTGSVVAHRAQVDAILQRPEARVLDLCCGTGDMTLLYIVVLLPEPNKFWARIFLTPCCSARRRRRKSKRKRREGSGAKLRWIEADALRLPFPDGHFNLVTRHSVFETWPTTTGLREIARVLAPGGECASSISANGGLIGQCYRVYFKKILPASGR